MRRRAACSDRSRGGWSRISSVGANEPQLLIFLVAAFDLIETPSRIDLFRMPSNPLPSQSTQGSFQIRLAPIGDDLPYRTSPSESSQSFYFPFAFSPSSTSRRIYIFENNLSVDLSNRLSPPTEFR